MNVILCKPEGSDISLGSALKIFWDHFVNLQPVYMQFELMGRCITKCKILDYLFDIDLLAVICVKLC